MFIWHRGLCQRAVCQSSLQLLFLTQFLVLIIECLSKAGVDSLFFFSSSLFLSPTYFQSSITMILQNSNGISSPPFSFCL